MSIQLDACNPARLRLLAEDRLSPAQLFETEEHLEWCADCRAELDRQLSLDGDLTSVRKHLGTEPTGGYEPQTTALDDALSFLAPSDWPDSLGRLGSYEVKGVLGRGGMGVVLKAFDPALSRNVAIKVLSSSLATCGAARRRFLREARAAAAVVHEHVVGVFAVVESAGLPFLVMEYVPGRSLQDRLDRTGALSLPEVLRIGTQTAAGLAAAHAQGLVHRDVKPANILLENGVERVRLTDFGLARASADAALTRSGVIAGTPHYMAPEQASGETTDYRADLFSLGSTLYAICAGNPPFRAETPLAVVRRVCDHQPRPLRELNPEVPAWLEAIVFRLMDKDPARRFQSAAEVADLLQRCLAHVQQPLTVPQPPELAEAEKRRSPGHRAWRRAVLAGLVMTGVAFVVFNLISPGSWNSSHPRQKAAVAFSTTPDTMPDDPRLSARPDEIAQQLRNAWGLAGQIESGLHRSSNESHKDLVAALEWDLTRQVESLERAITADRDSAVPNVFVHPKMVPDPRR
jgi:serine/threonine-protein kinase